MKGVCNQNFLPRRSITRGCLTHVVSLFSLRSPLPFVNPIPFLIEIEGLSKETYYRSFSREDECLQCHYSNDLVGDPPILIHLTNQTLRDHNFSPPSRPQTRRLLLKPVPLDRDTDLLRLRSTGGRDKEDTMIPRTGRGVVERWTTLLLSLSRRRDAGFIIYVSI